MKTKILGIAPYEGMKTLMEQCAMKYPNIEITVFIGDLETGAHIAKAHTGAEYDIILSRGGTAEMIRHISVLPVVEIPLTIYDMLRSIKLAENYHNKYAIIGFPAITKNAHFLCDVLRYDIDIHTIHNEEDARETLRNLSHEGYGMVLCDVITHSLAQRFGIPAMLINSGAESVESALEQAILTNQTYSRLRRQTDFYRELLAGQDVLLQAYDASGEKVFSSREEEPPSLLLDKMRGALPGVVEGETRKIQCEQGGQLHTIKAKPGQLGEKNVAIFSLRSKRTQTPLAKSGIVFTNREEAYDRFFNSFYGITQSSSPSDMTVDEYARSRKPLMILGEIGTGKEPMARLVYAKSGLCDNPLITIDCAQLQERAWHYLFENDNSPLNGDDATIHIKQLKVLSDAQFHALCEKIKALEAHKRNRLVFAHPYDENIGMTAHCRHIVNFFSCLTLYMPPLRSHKQDIPSLASLYTSTLNMRMAREIIGFDDDALALLQAYDWPGNYDQFKRVMEELVLACTTSYIPTSSVRKILQREIGLVYARPSATQGLNLQRTLEEINLDILRQVLAEEGGNQSAAAKRLGISRTTLWRMMQKITSPPSAR